VVGRSEAINTVLDQEDIGTAMNVVPADPVVLAVLAAIANAGQGDIGTAMNVALAAQVVIANAAQVATVRTTIVAPAIIALPHLTA
jgi:hypothetical protein